MFLEESNHIVHMGEEVTESQQLKTSEYNFKSNYNNSLNFLLKADLSAPKSSLHNLLFSKRKRREEIEKQQQKIALRTGW